MNNGKLNIVSKEPADSVVLFIRATEALSGENFTNYLWSKFWIALLERLQESGAQLTEEEKASLRPFAYKLWLDRK